MLLLQRTLISICACIALPLYGASAQAQVYKCRHEATGKIEFSGTRCDSNSTGNEIKVQPNEIDTSAIRTQMNQPDGKDQPAGRATGQAAQERDPVDRSSSSGCVQARRSYENEAGSVTKNPNAINAKRAAMSVACGLNAETGNTTEDRSNSRECIQAQRAYDNEAGSIRQDAGAINARRSAMYVACGQVEPRRNVRSGQDFVTTTAHAITHCDTAGCLDNMGLRYARVAGQDYVSPTGASCRLTGNVMHCN